MMKMFFYTFTSSSSLSSTIYGYNFWYLIGLGLCVFSTNNYLGYKSNKNINNVFNSYSSFILLEPRN